MPTQAVWMYPQQLPRVSLHCKSSEKAETFLKYAKDLRFHKHEATTEESHNMTDKNKRNLWNTATAARVYDM